MVAGRPARQVSYKVRSCELLMIIYPAAEEQINKLEMQLLLVAVFLHRFWFFQFAPFFVM